MYRVLNSDPAKNDEISQKIRSYEEYLQNPEQISLKEIQSLL